MARILGRLLAKGRSIAQARAAELRGELAQAAALFACAGRLDEAARVMVLRGDGEPDLSQRLRHYVQALAVAPEGSSMRVHVRRRHSSTVVAMAAEAPITAALKRDLANAAAELEAIGDHGPAARAYAYAGDIEGQARTLALAGEVDALDRLLDEEQRRDRDVISRRGARDEMALLIASGRRREAATMARASADDAVRERGRSIELQRVAGSIVNAIVRGRRMAIALGDEIVIGRAPEGAASTARARPGPGSAGVIAVAGAAVSRRHVAIARHNNGEVVVRDLGSRNATTLGGRALSGDALVGDGVELRLGRNVPLVVRPASEIAGAVAIEVAGMRCIAPLGPAILGVGRWRLERGEDAWVELSTDDDPPAFAGSFRLVTIVTLLAGDKLAEERGGSPAFEVRPDDG
jgi:hypothetical protein